MSKSFDRRDFLKLGGAAAALAAAGCATTGGAKGRVVVIGGGFGGATAAKYIRLWGSGVEVTLVERQTDFVSCPISNLVYGGSKTMADITYGYSGLARYGVQVVRDEATAVDAYAKVVRLARGGELKYDRLVVSPGIDFMYEQIDGYRAAMDAYDLQGGAAQLIELAARANRYVEETTPWALAKAPARAAELDTVLANLARTVARLAGLAAPFMPEKAAAIWTALGLDTPFERLTWDACATPVLDGRRVAKPPVLFPKPAPV